MRKPILSLFALSLLLLAPLFKAEAQTAVIVNKANPIDDLSIKKLKQLYLGKVTSLANGKKVYLTEYVPIRKAFYKSVLRMSTNKVKKHWISLVLSGKNATPPKRFSDIIALKKYVIKTPGAISFVELSKIDNSVKVIKIDGKMPGDADYPLN